MAVAALLGRGLVLYPLLAGVGGGWAFLLLLRVRPLAAHAVVRWLPRERLRLFAAEMLVLLEANLRAGFLARLEDPAFHGQARWAGVDPEIGDEARDD